MSDSDQITGMRPIKTAPRDGSDVWLLVKVAAHWQPLDAAILMSAGWKLELDTAQALVWWPVGGSDVQS